MKRFLAVAVFVTVAVLGANAHAQQETGDQGTGFYIGGHLGVNAPSDSEINGGALKAQHDALIGFGGVMGYDFGNFRVDGEIALRLNTTDRLGNLSLKRNSFGSNRKSNTFAFSYMINGYFDLPTEGPLKPYIGGGVGFATVSIDWETPGFFLSNIPVADDNDTGFAYQISGGIGYEINPRTTVSFSYRYFAVEELQMVFAGGSPINPGQPFTMEYQSNEFNLGVRFMFN